MSKYIESLLPQIQCTQCGYQNCKLYAESIVFKKESINKCIPGSKSVILKIAKYLKIDINTINKSEIIFPVSRVAWIDENLCIGCTKCIQVCPVDAIIGAIRMMHTVVKDFCIGCNICVKYCPTNCIKLHNIDNSKLDQCYSSIPILFFD